MTTEYDVIVAGAGMMGSAAARHLAATGRKVALVGPSEPADNADHTGVFASHYDEARITRRIDTNVDWSKLATESIRRYGEIERQSGQAFYHEVGCLMAGAGDGPESDFVKNCLTVCDRNDIPHERLIGPALTERFPFFSFPDAVTGLFQARDAGYVNPRALVAAQKAAAESLGADVIDQEVTAIDERADSVTVRCQDGTVLRGQRVVVSCGAFSDAAGLLPAPLNLRNYARTIALVEVGREESERLKGMPSLIYVSPDQRIDVYVLPPVLYPDGKTYLKIGGDPVDVVLPTVDALKTWFRGNGDPAVRDLLVDQLLTIMPTLRYESISFKSCATSYTRIKQPAIAHQSDRIVALCGGNGSAAKSSDEIGRIGAALVSGDPDYAAGYGLDFKP
ncbi:FAD-dependent oxidoreductase [Hwanghaeella sp.]|uniref:FAD-dependent oxidoreductase n=1 Tax=Hwanghaeella sp. TaxID=2605943 RepID=UPI003CCBADDC